MDAGGMPGELEVCLAINWLQITLIHLHLQLYGMAWMEQRKTHSFQFEKKCHKLVSRGLRLGVNRAFELNLMQLAWHEWHGAINDDI